jgi:hypothetical protein
LVRCRHLQDFDWVTKQLKKALDPKDKDMVEAYAQEKRLLAFPKQNLDD